MKVLIAPWGNPWRAYPGDFAWDPVEYCVEGFGCERSRTTLPLLYKYLKPDVVVVLALDTALHKVDALGGTASGGVSYDRIIKAVEEQYREFVEALFKESFADEGEARRAAERVAVVVAPGVGTFKNSVRFDGATTNLYVKLSGQLKDFYSYALAKLALRILDEFGKRPGGESVELHLDLTHGINYMPAMTYRAVRELSSALAWGLEVRVCVYNSEPYRPGLTASLTIHKIEESRAQPLTDFGRVCGDSGCRLAKLFKVLEQGEEASRIGREVKEKIAYTFCKLCVQFEDVGAFVSALTNGLPLALVTFLPDPDKLRQLIEYALGMYREYTEVRTEQSGGDYKVEISHRIGFSDLFDGLVLAWVTAATVVRVAQLEPCFIMNEGIEYELLKRIIDEVFGRIAKFNYTIARDLYEIDGALAKAPQDFDWTPLAELLKAEGREYRCDMNEIRSRGWQSFVRNLVAHSGFEKCVTMVKRSRGKVYLKYGDCAIDLVRKALIEVLARS